MLKESGAEQLKIIDFGTAQDLSINPNPKVMVGTPEFIGTSIIRLSLCISRITRYRLDMECMELCDLKSQ